MRISDWSSDVCSSDLAKLAIQIQRHAVFHLKMAQRGGAVMLDPLGLIQRLPGLQVFCQGATVQFIDGQRSEEHTSELQSLMRIPYAVFCLQKKKTNKSTIKHSRKYKCKHPTHV